MRKMPPGLAEATAAGDAEKAQQILAASSLLRKCGRCTGCCTALGVTEIGKKDGETCKHEVKHRGCAIYDTRPDQCRNFLCLWKLGLGRSKDAPDKIGVVFDSYQNDLGQTVLRAAEMWSGAMRDGGDGMALAIKLMGAADQLLVLRKDGARMIRYR